LSKNDALDFAQKLAYNMMDTSYTVKFSFYGFGIEVKCQDTQTLQNIQRDYSFFLSEEVVPKVIFEIFNEAPDYNKFPHIKANLYTPRNICYRQKNLYFIDYFGRGILVIDHCKDIYRVFCPDSHLRHEIVFLSILSLVGQNFDLRNIHRVHGLGLAVGNKAILILLPSGGGKTTLLLDIIKNEFVKLISEDSPLIDRSGKAFPFPIRIGVSRKDKPQDIPDAHLHFIKRMEFGPKYTIDIDVFKNKIAREPLPVEYILCGARCLGSESYIKPLSKHSALGELVKNSVVGLGLYQGIEFLFQEGIFELFKKSGVLFSRFKNASKVASRSKTYSFVIGSDRRKNVETFLNFCQENINKKSE
jgi:GTPase SAR1 family protein